jgi:hypothetical protein
LSISINSNDVNINVPLHKVGYDNNNDNDDSLHTHIEVPVNIVSKYYGTIPPMTISLMSIPFTHKDYILKAIIYYINTA